MKTLCSRGWGRLLLQPALVATLLFSGGCVGRDNTDYNSLIEWERTDDSLLYHPDNGRIVAGEEAAFFRLKISWVQPRALSGKAQPIIDSLLKHLSQTWALADIERYKEQELAMYQEEITSWGSIASDAKDEVHFSYRLHKEVESDLRYDYGNVISLHLSTYSDEGSPRPYTTTTYINYDLKRNRPIPADLFFRTEDDEAITQLIVEAIVQKYGDSTLVGKPVDLIERIGFYPADEISRPNTYSITSTGVLFLFGYYEIAPFYMGEVEVEVPADKIRDYIRDEYQHLFE